MARPVEVDLNVNANQAQRVIDELLKGVDKLSEESKVAAGSVDGITKRIQALTKARNASNDPKQIAAYNDEINKQKNSLTQLTSSTNKQNKETGIFSTLLDKAGLSGLSFTKVLGGLGLGAAASLFAALGKEVSQYQGVQDTVQSTLAPLISSFEVLSGAIATVIRTGGRQTKTFSDLRKETRRLTFAKRQLIKANQDLRESDSDVARNNAILIPQLADLQSAADDNTKSLEERRAASISASKIEIEIAQNNLDLALEQERQAITARNSFDVDSKKRIEAEKVLNQAITNRANAEAELRRVTADGLRRTAEIVQDDAELRLDILIDGAQKQREILQQQAEDENIPIAARRKAIRQLSQLNEQNANDQVKVIQRFTKESIDLNDLVNESDAGVLDNKIKSFGLSEVLSLRLLEVIRERQDEEVTLGNITKEIDEDEQDRQKGKLETIQGINQGIKDSDRELLEFEKELDEEEFDAFAEQFDKRKEQEEAAANLRLSLAQLSAEKEIAIQERKSRLIAAAAIELNSVIQGLLGDNLAAQLAGLAIEALINTALVRISTASAQASNLARAAAVGPPQNIPLLAIAAGQNAVLQANAETQQAQILAAAAVQAGGAIVGSFQSGGIVEGNQYVGDRLLARVNSDEMILNRQQQAELFRLANGGGRNNNQLTEARVVELAALVTRSIPIVESELRDVQETVDRRRRNFTI